MSLLTNSNFSNELGRHDLSPVLSPYETLELSPFEVAILTIDLRNLPNNITYGEHYRFSVYENCQPCPPRYFCTEKDGDTICESPPVEQQYHYLNQCLLENKIQACTKSDGSLHNPKWCREQLNSTQLPTKEKDAFTNSYLLFEIPDLTKCLMQPIFGADRVWPQYKFRQLCQNTFENGKKSCIYDCRQASDYEKYLRWKNNLCFSNAALMALDSCSDDFQCKQSSEIDKIINENYLNQYVSETKFETKLTLYS